MKRWRGYQLKAVCPLYTIGSRGLIMDNGVIKSDERRTRPRLHVCPTIFSLPSEFHVILPESSDSAGVGQDSYAAEVSQVCKCARTGSLRKDRPYGQERRG